MKNLTLIFGAVYGLLSIILGAFGAHALKKMISAERLTSFETGVRYQMYSALFLLLIGFFLKMETPLERSLAWLMIVGTILFSFSIYLLSMQDAWQTSFKFLGPVTPLGGLLMILSWAGLLWYFLKNR